MIQLTDSPQSSSAECSIHKSTNGQDITGEHCFGKNIKNCLTVTELVSIFFVEFI